MTDTKMSFKDALIAHLNGENVQTAAENDGNWFAFDVVFGNLKISQFEIVEGHKFRIKPRTVMCNGVEVPAPESSAPSQGSGYWVPAPRGDDYVSGFMEWHGDNLDLKWLERGLVYLSKDAAAERAKAMLITK